VPHLRLPLSRERRGPGALLSLLVHAATIGVLLVGSGEWLARRAGEPNAPRERGGGGGGPRSINFFILPSPHPAAVDFTAPPHLLPTDLPTLERIPVTLPPLELPRFAPPVALVPMPAAAVPGLGGGGGGGVGEGVGAGAGADVGPGTGGEGGYIFGASPRTAILPPMARVPGSVAGRTYRVQFWLAADGRVTRVEVDPPIRDANYSREFRERMMAYQFHPAHIRDGRSVASIFTITLRIGH
jgi:hypothetical protein